MNTPKATFLRRVLPTLLALTLALSLSWAISACTTCGERATQAKDPRSPRPVETLSGHLHALTTATVGFLDRASPAERNLSGVAFLRSATDDGAGSSARLLGPFDGYSLKEQHTAQHVVILVCDHNGKRALLEDSSHTPGSVDRLWYQQNDVPAHFTLTP